MEIISDIQRKQTAARHDEQEHYIAPRQQYHMRTMSIFDVIPVTAAVFGNVVDSNFYNQPKSITTDASTITAPCQTNDSDNEHRKVSLTQDPSNSVISLPAAIAEQPSYAQNYHTFFDNGIDILPRIKQCEALLDSISLSSYSQEIEALRKENEERYMACERLFDKADDTWSISSQLEINRKDGIFVM